ncbi:MAG: SMK killer toxin resistance protein [Thelocarpon superellum]|nr:MAG: SMK killer toxin resistance protein [Thelocarpon superellum]
MATFITDLCNSIFTPGPTPTLVVATNASFACLQLVLLLLLIGTRSVHFLVLSFLTAGLWWAINWFVAELSVATAREEEAARLRATKVTSDGPESPDDETETEDGRAAGATSEEDAVIRSAASRYGLGDARRRRDRLEVSGELSTEDEWEKVSEEGGKEK